MKTSIVMAVYNGQKYIKKQLVSIKDQTRQIDEVIIIDDCSTDDSPKIVAKFIEENHLVNWQLKENKRNLGYIGNFKKGLSLATGDIIFLCDQDDVWKLNKIEKMVNILENHQNIYSLAASFEFINQKDEKFNIVNQKNKSNNNLIDFVVDSKLTEIDLKYLLRCNFSQGCTMAIRKKIVKEYLNVFSNTIPHDWALNLIAAVHHGCYYLDEKLIEYRIHNENTIGLDFIEDSVIDEKSKRTKNRLSYLEAELDKTEYILSFNLKIDDYKMCLENKKYLSDRIVYLKEKKILKLCIYFIKGRYKKFGKLKTFLGDLISIFRRMK